MKLQVQVTGGAKVEAILLSSCHGAILPASREYTANYQSRASLSSHGIFAAQRAALSADAIQ